MFAGEMSSQYDTDGRLNQSKLMIYVLGKRLWQKFFPPIVTQIIIVISYSILRIELKGIQTLQVSANARHALIAQKGRLRHSFQPKKVENIMKRQTIWKNLVSLYPNLVNLRY